MNYRSYFKLRIELRSPLSIGDSISADTDRDVVLNSKKQPIIPASSIAGVFRSLEPNEDIQKLHFGYVPINTGMDPEEAICAVESKLKFYDASLPEGDGYAVSARDCVALDENKTARQGAKFDFQCVENGSVFIGYIEAESKESADYVEKALQKEISLGSKTTRGYGRVSVSYMRKDFDFSSELEDWLDFDMFCGDYGSKWIKPSNTTATQEKRITLTLLQKGGLCIRQYLTDPKEVKDESIKELKPDYGPLSLRDGTPVIPGTSWAGLFRSHIAKVLGCGSFDDDINAVFGFVDEKKSISQKSQISFNESMLQSCTHKILTRNAIDRFTNGTKDGALYTEKTVFDGKTELQIVISKASGKPPADTKILRALCVSIMDLAHGFIAIGGLTSVGRGMFAVESVRINDKPLEAVEYSLLEEAICNG